MTQLTDAWRSLVPRRDDPNGPLPPLLLMLTIVTGLVDAFSYLELQHVLVANMTGNVVFLAFALGGVSGFVWWASALAIAMFMLGALIGGRVTSRYGSHRGEHLYVGALIQFSLVAASLVVVVVEAGPHRGVAPSMLIVLLGIALGLQNATARSLGVPDLTTTVLTLTITGIAADSHAAGGSSSKIGRRLISVGSMFLGGLVGAALVQTNLDWLVLALAAALLLVVVTMAFRVRKSRGGWTAAKK
jgi:uncharacterized membrane protein YoaK (UPF0700 family)